MSQGCSLMNATPVYLQSFERSINLRHVYTKTDSIYTYSAPQAVPPLASLARAEPAAAQLPPYLQSERDLSIAGMYIQSRQHLTRTGATYDHPGRRGSRSPRC